MPTLSKSTPLPKRRQFLTLVGAATLTTVAGCTGDAAPSTTAPDSTDTDTDTIGGPTAAPCAALDGESTLLTPGDRQFPLLFEYPDTFEEYNSNINESSSIIGAQLGHSASAETNSYPVNIAIHQNKYVTSDAETGSNWVTSFGSADRLDWMFTYQGKTIEVYDATPYEDATAAVWRFLLPVADPEGVRPITVQFTDDRSETTCFESLTAIAQAVIQSLTPNPNWEQPTAS